MVWSTLSLLPYTSFTNTATTSTTLQTLAMTSSLTIPLFAILVLIDSKLLLQYGAIIITIIGKLRPLFINGLQIALVVACAYNLTLPASNALHTVNGVQGILDAEQVVRLATAIFTGAGMTLAAITAVYVMEAAAANPVPVSLAEMTDLRPLRFEHLRQSLASTTALIRSRIAKQQAQTPAGVETATVFEEEEHEGRESSEDTDVHAEGSTSESDEAQRELDDYDELRKTDFEGWAQKTK